MAFFTNKLHPNDFAGYIVAQLLGGLTAAEGGGARLSLQGEQTAAATRTPGTGRDQRRGVELGRSAGTGPPGREMRDNLTPRFKLGRRLLTSAATGVVLKPASALWPRNPSALPQLQ